MTRIEKKFETNFKIFKKIFNLKAFLSFFLIYILFLCIFIYPLGKLYFLNEMSTIIIDYHRLSYYDYRMTIEYLCYRKKYNKCK